MEWRCGVTKMLLANILSFRRIYTLGLTGFAKARKFVIPP